MIIETREQIVGLYRRTWAHSDATINTLALDTVGRVPWWQPERNEVPKPEPITTQNTSGDASTPTTRDFWR